jgi:hypothetical protein
VNLQAEHLDMEAKKKSRKKRVLMIVVLVLLAIAGWVLNDLYAPRTAHLREFDADEVARLETAMWRSPGTGQAILWDRGRPARNEREARKVSRQSLCA